MAEKLSVIGIIIAWKWRNFVDFPHIMEQCRRDQKVTVNEWVGARKIFAHICHTQSMFEKSSHKAVMYTFCRRMFAKFFDKFLIFDKKHFQQFGKIWIFNTIHICHYFGIHFFDIFVRRRNVIRRVIFALFTAAHA